MSDQFNPQSTPTKADRSQAASAEKPQAGQNGRDANGKFAKGNEGGPGNPFARQVGTIRKAFLNRATEEQIGAIADALIEKAKQGDVAAAKLVLQYTIGKPAEAVEPDRLDKEEFDHFVETSGMFAKTAKIITEPAPVLPLSMLRAVRPAMARDVGRRMSGVMKGEIDHYGNPIVAAPSPNGKTAAGTSSQRQAPSSNGNLGDEKPARRDTSGSPAPHKVPLPNGINRVAGLAVGGEGGRAAPSPNGKVPGGMPAPLNGAPSTYGKLQPAGR